MDFNVFYNRLNLKHRRPNLDPSRASFSFAFSWGSSKGTTCTALGFPGSVRPSGPPGSLPRAPQAFGVPVLPEVTGMPPPPYSSPAGSPPPLPGTGDAAHTCTIHSPWAFPGPVTPPRSLSVPPFTVRATRARAGPLTAEAGGGPGRGRGRAGGCPVSYVLCFFSIPTPRNAAANASGVEPKSPLANFEPLAGCGPPFSCPGDRAALGARPPPPPRGEPPAPPFRGGERRPAAGSPEGSDGAAAAPANGGRTPGHPPPAPARHGESPAPPPAPRTAALAAAAGPGRQSGG